MIDEVNFAAYFFNVWTGVYFHDCRGKSVRRTTVIKGYEKKAEMELTRIGQLNFRRYLVLLRISENMLRRKQKTISDRMNPVPTKVYSILTVHYRCGGYYAHWDTAFYGNKYYDPEFGLFGGSEYRMGKYNPLFSKIVMPGWEKIPV